MKYCINFFLIIFICLCITTGNSYAQTQAKVDVWLTTPDKSALFARQNEPLFFNASPGDNTINLDDTKTCQSVTGFGFALTGGSAMHIINMDAASRSALLHDVFDTTGNHIGVSYLRVSIGASDLNDHIFSYDDLPSGETDVTMKKFDLGPDKKDVIPVLQEILKINPSLKIFGSPWSPAVWMKTNSDTRGGRLKPEYYTAYANYFVKYIKQMRENGITIDAVTVQNEPLHPGNNPSLLLTAPEEKNFIKNALGPAFAANHITTKIWIYDHNADRPDYPISILDDPGAAKYIDGSAFHLYGGKIEALDDVHDAHPDKNIYFTEQMVVQFHDTDKMLIAHPVAEVIIGASRHWCRNIFEWNLAAGADFRPYTSRGGCSECQGAVTISGNIFAKNIAYYSMAHISKFVRPGSVRVATNQDKMLSNVAFTTPDGKVVLIVANTGNAAKNFTIKYHGKYAAAMLEAHAAATYVWDR